jgi:hypothetical protein
VSGRCAGDENRTASCTFPIFLSPAEQHEQRVRRRVRPVALERGHAHPHLPDAVVLPALVSGAGEGRTSDVSDVLVSMIKESALLGHTTIPFNSVEQRLHEVVQPASRGTHPT